MKILFLDYETTDVPNGKKKRDPSPFLADNKIVSFGYKTRGYTKDAQGYHFINHSSGVANSADACHNLQHLLDEADILVAFNAKFELEWTLEAGFKYDKPVYDPMVVEYILARGVKAPLHLDACCERRGAIRKLGVLVDDLWDSGKTFFDMPKDIVEEYGNGDIDALESLYDKQQILLAQPENAGLIPTINMSNEFIIALVEMERNGIHIDAEALASVRKQFTEEYQSLRKDLEAIAQEVMGDTKINLDSPEQLSWLIYSRKVINKHAWRDTFNIGTDDRGKRKRPPRMSGTAFADAVKRNTVVLKRTLSKHCAVCDGQGVLRGTLTKAGNIPKRLPKCSSCGGVGYLLLDTGKVAGFKLSPKGPIDTASGGFATDKESLEQLIVRVNTNTEIGLKAREFLEKSIRYSAVGTYIATFVDGIERNRGAKGILHTKLMQCVARTGRLSSQDPNFQNMPRANTFPVRRVVTSRFVNGRILEVDFAQLEFRIAAYLAQDARAIQDIADKIDAHSFTAKTLTDAGQSTNRQDAKPHTFKPLYGGSSGTDAEVTYYKAFKEKYCGITRWQDSNIQSVLRGDVLRIPSGREYLFPGTRRTPSGYVVNTTQICNYPVQGFATADVVPVVIIEILRRLRKASCRSLLILTVHDSVVLDVHPDELEIINGVVCGSFGALLGILKSRYGCEVNLPLDHETKIGQNWLEMKTI